MSKLFDEVCEIVKSASAGGEFLSRDDARLALFQAIEAIKIGNKTDDKLILDQLWAMGCSIARLPNVGTAQEVSTESNAAANDEAVRRDAERYRWLRDPCSGAEHVVFYGRGDYGRGLKSGTCLDTAIDAFLTTRLAKRF